MRYFVVAAFMPPDNKRQESMRIPAKTVHAAAKQFAGRFGADLYTVRIESPTEWSAGWSGSGQRIWIRELKPSVITSTSNGYRRGGGYSLSASCEGWEYLSQRRHNTIFSSCNYY